MAEEGGVSLFYRIVKIEHVGDNRYLIAEVNKMTGMRREWAGAPTSDHGAWRWCTKQGGVAGMLQSDRLDSAAIFEMTLRERHRG